MPTTATYTIERVLPEHLQDQKLLEYLATSAKQVAKLYGNKFDWKNFSLRGYLSRYRFMLCRRNGVPVGFMMARLYDSIFDPEKAILMQDLLFAEPGTRAAHVLMQDFIDFGKANANHIITMIAEHSNIKPSSLERYGFKQLETLYRIEVE